MTDFNPRPADDGASDATIPLVPEAGYSPTEQLPFAEETLTDTPVSPWSAASQLGFTAPDYGTPTGGYGTSTPASQAQTNYVQPQANYPQPQANYPQPQANYPQPQANYSQPSTGYGQAGFAEPAGPAASIPAQNIYQGYPAAGSGQQAPNWPAVIQDPVGYDYGYSQAPAAAEHPNAVVSMVLGIVGLAFFQLLSPVAWFLAARGRRQMAAYPGRWRPSGALTAGLVLGILGTCLLGLMAAGLFVLMFLATG